MENNTWGKAFGGSQTPKTRELHTAGEMLLLLRNLTRELQMENMRVMFPKISQDMEVGIQLVWIALGY